MPRLFRISLAKVGIPFVVLFCAQIPWAQTPGQTSRQEPEVLRVYTDLVQTDVMVFDKEGRFVNGLKKEDFELRLDGKPKPIEFFEKVTAGSVAEETQLAAARGSTGRANSNGGAGLAPLDRGRPIFFYVDDLHLDPRGVNSTQKLIANFIDREMGQNDEAAIVSASGQIGFLQQLTDNKVVLRAAVNRLKFRPYSVRDGDSPAMSEYQAMVIDNNDRDVTDYFVQQELLRSPGMTRPLAITMVQSRARSILRQASNVTKNTLLGLEGLVRTAETLPGRKLLFFISAGFFIDHRNSDSVYQLRKIISAAARNGVVIYSMDARGLVAPMGDASSEAAFDPTGRLLRAAGGELTASQDALFSLAKDTGGKAIMNTNDMRPGLINAVRETSGYYLLAWKPEREAQASRFRRIEVKVTGRPELTVRVRRGFFDVEPEPVAKPKKTKDTGSEQISPEVELRKVVAAPYPNRDIPISLRLSYVDTPNTGGMLSIGMQVPTEFLSFELVKGKQTGVVAITGTVLNDQGLAGSNFNQRITATAKSADQPREGEDLIYGHSIRVKPGLYQVRVGARDEKSGRSGSAHAWIEIPNLSDGALALSSLIIGVRAQPSTDSTATSDLLSSTELRVAHRFSPNDFLRFLMFIYNASPVPADGKPDVALQLQVVRDEIPVVTAPLKKVATESVTDLKRIPYAAELSLAGLPAGRYVLQLSVVDRVAKRSASQSTRFDID